MNYKINLTPRSEREATIQKRLEASTETDILYDFRGDKATLRVISLPVDVPVYRMDNCRTYSDQQDMIAKQGLDKTYFSKGQELSSVQAAQHELLAKLASKSTSSVSSISEVLEKEGQRGAILITSTGVVVNGNRRLSAIRELYAAADCVPSCRWAHVKCLVLPADTSADEVDDIEAYEQARPQTKLEYDWIGDAQLVRRQINKGRTPKQVADQIRRNEADIKNLLQSIDEADLYLNEWAKKPGQYSIVSGDAEQIFGDIPKKLVGKPVPLQDASRAIAWSLFENRDKITGRIYSYNAAFGKLAETVLADMAEQLDIETVEISDTSADDDFLIDIDLPSVSTDYTPIINALRSEETKAEAVDVLIDACQSAIERENGQKSKGAALKALVQVHSKLAAVDLTMAGKDTYSSIQKQLDSIGTLLTKLNGKLVTLRGADADTTQH